MASRKQSANVYRLPFSESLEIKIAKAPFHYESAWQKHAIDFCMPLDTPIIAAYDGIVHEVIDTNTLGGPDKNKYRKYANLIIIEHENDEYSGYCHLRKDCPVKEGQYVKAGDVIAYSAITGFCGYPHLHFQIMKSDKKGHWTTIPARFLIGNHVKVLRSPK